MDCGAPGCWRWREPLSSEELYRSIGGRDRGRIALNDLSIDRLAMDPRHDGRLGVSLILQAGLDGAAYGALVEGLRSSEPGQYYYPREDLHTTIFDFLSAREGYVRDPGLESAFLSIGRRTCAEAGAPSLRYGGLCCGREA